MFTTVFCLLSVGPQTIPVEFKVEGAVRTAIACIPEKPSHAPLVFIWHGHGGSAQHSLTHYAVHRYWPEAIVLYMNGMPTKGRTDPEGNKPGWQKQKGEYGDRDLKLFDAALKWAKETYHIDPNRVYAGGHSNGGAFTYLLWSDRRSDLAAVAASGAGFGRNALYAKPLPALIIAGQKDQLVSFSFQMLSLKAALRINKCDPKGAPAGQMMELHKSSIGADVLTYIYPGDHTMPVDTGQKMAEFFKKYKRTSE